MAIVKEGVVLLLMVYLAAAAPIFNDPMIEASRRGDLNEVKRLVESGCYTRTMDHQGYSAIHQAASRGHYDVVDYLLRSGANIDAQRAGHGSTAFKLAARKGHFKIVELLLARGANIYLRDHSGWSALMDALHSKHWDIAKLLLERRPHKDTDLLIASRTDCAQHSCDEVALRLLDYGANPSTSDNTFSALMYAIKRPRLDLAFKLVEKGADVNYQNKWGWTALMECAVRGYTELGKRLLTSQANINAVNEEGKSALDLAIQWQHGEFVKMLIQMGGNELTFNLNEVNDNQPPNQRRFGIDC